MNVLGSGRGRETEREDEEVNGKMFCLLLQLFIQGGGCGLERCNLKFRWGGGGGGAQFLPYPL